MTTRNRYLAWFDKHLKEWYRVLFKPALRKVGLDSHLKTLHRRFLSWASADIHLLKIGPTEVSIKTDNSNLAEQKVPLIIDQEERMINGLLREVEDGDVVYDVGAHVGIYTTLLSERIGDGDGSVYAFEPHPQNIDRLRENMEYNKTEARTFQIALSNETGKTTLVTKGQSDTGQLQASDETLNEGIEVQVTEGDKFRSKHDIAPPNLMKIDVEGAELDVLQGIEDTLINSECRLIYIELHPDQLSIRGNEIDDVVEYLASLGYSTEISTMRQGQPFLRAENKTSGSVVYS